MDIDTATLKAGERRTLARISSSAEYSSRHCPLTSKAKTVDSGCTTVKATSSKLVSGPGNYTSSDLATHLELYKHFPNVGGVAHTHSEFATAWAQAGKPIPCFGTTHADYFHGPVPVTPRLEAGEIAGDYEQATGEVICRTFAEIDPETIPAVLVTGHAPFCWGPSPGEAAHNAVTLEYVARMAYHTLVINAESQPLMRELHDKHFLRKHGQTAYYGQVKK